MKKIKKKFFKEEMGVGACFIETQSGKVNFENKSLLVLCYSGKWQHEKFVKNEFDYPLCRKVACSSCRPETLCSQG